MNEENNDRVYLVTGSSRGIGFYLAEHLARSGNMVIINGRDKRQLDKAVNSINGVIGLQGDVSNHSQAKELIEKAVRKFGKIDGLVCNVGNGASVPLGEETPEEWYKMFCQNFYSASNTVEAAKNTIIESRGSVVCISSICGQEFIQGAPATYSVAKAALNHYVLMMSKYFGRYGVRINAIAPGNIIFNGSVWEKKLLKSSKAVYQNLREEVALSKFGTPKDLAPVVEYLLSEDANFITGSIWTIDGGQTRV